MTQGQAAHLSIAVLPFANLSGDPSQDYFADGATDNLTTDLARIPNSFVIARNTAFSFINKNIDVKEIGKELGVRYVLEGSVQREQNRVRVNAQLVDTVSGAHLWAERFEENLADLFKLQEQVVDRLANSLGNELVKAEAEKASKSNTPDATDLTMRGREIQLLWWSQPSHQTKKNNESVRALFEQALKDDPNDADALAGIALTYDFEWEWGWANSTTDYDERIIRQADRALSLDPGNVMAYAAKTNFLQMTKRWDEAIRVADAGLAINPNSALLLAIRAKALNLAGRFDEAKTDLQKAMKLSPRDPQLGWWHEARGDAELGLGHFDAAAEEYQKDLELGHTTLGYLDIASVYALAGRWTRLRQPCPRPEPISARLPLGAAEACSDTALV
jgi:adenylate cyclase